MSSESMYWPGLGTGTVDRAFLLDTKVAGAQPAEVHVERLDEQRAKTDYCGQRYFQIYGNVSHGDIKPFHDRLRRGFVTSCRHGNILVMVTLLSVTFCHGTVVVMLTLSSC